MTDPTGPALALSDEERLTALVYGDTFSLYSPEEFEEFLAPLHERLRINGIGPEAFRGARCLDAGCGGGRGSVLMAEAGAREVVGVDLAPQNVASSGRRAAVRGLGACSFSQASLLDLPFEDDSFDVVWCNGVLHHSDDPDRALREITRVLRPGGRLWLYLYGSGGVYWRVVEAIRDLVAGVPADRAIRQLRLMDVPVRRIAEWVDDWFAPHLRRYTRADVTARLEELGYEDAGALTRGTAYDTSERRTRGAAEAALMGDGDVRMWARLAGPARGDARRLPDPPGGRGSPYDDDPAVLGLDAPLAEVAAAVDALEAARGHEVSAERLLVAATLHRPTRALLEDRRDYDLGALVAHLRAAAALVRDLAA